MMALLLLGCIDQGVSAIQFDAIAVVEGDFDNLGETLTALDISTQPYDGYIVQAAYDPEDDRRVRGYGAPSVEGLFTSSDESGRVQVRLFNAVFVNSGTRGLGAFQYNNTLESDDSLLLDTFAMEQACGFADSGGTLFVSDWAYDLVEHCWPDNIEFFGDDLTPDAAQAGMPNGAVLAEVRDEALKESLGQGISLTYDYSAWTVIESVNSATEVLLAGTVDYQPSADQLPQTLVDAPLMVRFATGRGHVIYTTFHVAAQTPQVAESLLLDTVEGLEEGAGEDSTEAAGVEEESSG